MKKKNKYHVKPTMDGATTTSWDWGFKPVPNKGGKTINSAIIAKSDKKETE